MSASHRKIGLIVHGQYDEAFAVGICTPGDLIKMDSARKVLRHATSGGGGEVMIAIEDGLQGYPPKELMSDYAVDDLVPFVRPVSGDVVNVNVPAAAAAIVKGDLLMSNGDGTFVKRTITNVVYGVAEEALDNSAGASKALIAMRVGYQQ